MKRVLLSRSGHAVLPCCSLGLSLLTNSLQPPFTYARVRQTNIGAQLETASELESMRSGRPRSRTCCLSSF